MRISDCSSDVCSSDLSCLCKSGWVNQAKRMSHIAISIPRVDWKPLKGCLELQSTSRLTELLPLGGAGVCKESSAFTKHLSSGTSTASRSEEHTSELQSLMRISYAVFCLKKKTHTNTH